MLKLLAPLFRLLTNRLLLSIIGLVLLCLIVWVVGPSVSIQSVGAPLEPPVSRLLAILGIVFTWAIYQIVKLSRSRQTNAAVVEKITAAPRTLPQGEVDVLRQKFKDASAALKTARFGKTAWGR